MRIAGHLTLAGSSARTSVVLDCTAEVFRITDAAGDILASGGLRDMRFEAPLGRAPRQVWLVDGSLFESDDHAGVDAINPNGAALGLHAAEAFRPRLFGFVALTVLASWLVWRYGVTLLVTAFVWLTPAQLTQVIDGQTLVVFDRTMFEPTTLTDAQQVALQADFADLVAKLERAEAHTPLRLTFRSGPMGPNAFALPGGTVVLTDDLVRLSEDRDLVAGVMAHEIGHVVHRHSLHQLYRALGIYAVVGFLAGETGPVLESLLLEGNLLLQLAYSREHEFEADAFAVDLAMRAGFDPSGMIRFFEHLIHEGLTDPLPSWGSTHPPHQDRIAAMRGLIAR